MIRQYSAKVEYPCGMSKAVISVVELNEKGRPLQSKLLEPGDIIHFRTSDPSTMHLPHPAVFQLHAIVSRILAMKAAAGFPVFPDQDWVLDRQDQMNGVMYDSEECEWLVDESDQLPGRLSEAQSAWQQLPFSLGRYPDFPPPPLSSTHSVASQRSTTNHPHTNCAYLNEQSRHVEVVNAEYSLRMTEMYNMMARRLGRQVDGDLWWI